MEWVASFQIQLIELETQIQLNVVILSFELAFDVLSPCYVCVCCYLLCI